jgi:hypothetical protein
VLDRTKHAGNRVAARHIGRHRDRSPAHRTNRFNDIGGFRHPMSKIHRDIGTCRGERDGYRAANSAGSTGHKSDPSGQIRHAKRLAA